MRLSELLNEKLSLAKAKAYTSYFVKERYEDIFNSYKQKWQKNNYRIYIPFSSKPLQQHIIPSDIKTFLQNKDIELIDYKKGIGKDKHNRNIKIGKVLAEIPDLQKKFVNDPTRKGSTQDNYYVVISRHPYDIAGMSTDRGWTSCMNLEGGSNKHKVLDDVVEGTLIAYCVREDDKNIENPLGRIRIHPYFKDENVVFGREYQIYGDVPTEFTRIIDEWLQQLNRDFGKKVGLYIRSNKTYVDSASQTLYFGDKDMSKEEFNELTNNEIAELLVQNFNRFKQFIDDDILKRLINDLFNLDTLRALTQQNKAELLNMVMKSELDDEKHITFLFHLFKNDNPDLHGYKTDSYEVIHRLTKYIPAMIMCYNTPTDLTDDQLLEIIKQNIDSLKFIEIKIEQKRIIKIINGNKETFKDLLKHLQVYSHKPLNELSPAIQSIFLDMILKYNLDQKLIKTISDLVKNNFVKDNPQILYYYKSLSNLDTETLYKIIEQDIRNITYINNLPANYEDILYHILEQFNPIYDAFKNEYVSYFIRRNDDLKTVLANDLPEVLPLLYVDKSFSNDDHRFFNHVVMNQHKGTQLEEVMEYVVAFTNNIIEITLDSKKDTLNYKLIGENEFIDYDHLTHYISNEKKTLILVIDKTSSEDN